MKSNFIQDFCEKNELFFLEYLHQNFDKDTSVVKVNHKNTNEIFVLKILGTNANKSIRDSFENEISFYKRGTFSFSPRLISFGENYLLIEFIDNYSLREHINSNFFSKKTEFDVSLLLEGLSNVLQEFFSSEKGIFFKNSIDPKDAKDIMFDRIGNLIASGPEFAKPIKLEQFVMRQFYKIIQSYLKNKFFNIVNGWTNDEIKYVSDFGHYDLHSENILVGKTYKIIDYGNFKSPGIWISDILYLYATIFASFSSNEKIQNQIVQEAYSFITKNEPKLSNTKFFNLVRVYCHAADTNSRFRIENRGIKILKIFKFLHSVKLLE